MRDSTTMSLQFVIGYDFLFHVKHYDNVNLTNVYYLANISFIKLLCSVL